MAKLFSPGSDGWEKWECVSWWWEGGVEEIIYQVIGSGKMMLDSLAPSSVPKKEHLSNNKTLIENIDLLQSGWVENWKV